MASPQPSAPAAALEIPESSCRSCGRALNGPFCSQCGQKRMDRLAAGRLASDLREQLLGMDFRLVQTVQSLFTRPGEMLREYLVGRRLPYTNPLKLLFLTATAYLVAVSLLDLRLAFVSESQETATTVVALINYLLFLFLVPCAAWLRVLYRRSGHNWAESYVVLCYLWSGYLMIAIVLGIAMAALPEWYAQARSAAGLVYITAALGSLYRVGWLGAIWRGILFYLGYILSAMLVMSVVVVLAHWVGFEPLQLFPMSR